MEYSNLAVALRHFEKLNQLLESLLELQLIHEDFYNDIRQAVSEKVFSSDEVINNYPHYEEMREEYDSLSEYLLNEEGITFVDEFYKDYPDELKKEWVSFFHTTLTEFING